jgi:hypothetical protein
MNGKIWSRDLSNMGEAPMPRWMQEIAPELIGQLKIIPEGTLLPMGVIVGSAVIENVTRADDFYRWHLRDIRRAARLRKPKNKPHPVWFRPF